MSISTGKGDKGETSLWSGERVSKDCIRVESYGTIDELNSFIGDAKHYITLEEIRNILEEIQNDLFKVAGELASLSKEFIKPIRDDDVLRLTNYVHKYENEIGLKGFVIPGSTVGSAKLDICRTIARRAERLIVKLSKEEKV
ncbi:MAG: cob(I)yrinic acid a,c-diamide adenosyltransferase, partial [Spirochaetes bacterium]|nr:cob(I)yrinic acid a,c-diamide adenosyltransferase [Spirochaetota bacterium]